MGGGVGLYIKKGLNFKIRSDLEKFHQKTFENITIEISYPNKNILISNVYHSPNPPSGYTAQAHSNKFLEILDAHLCELSDCNKDAYVFLDSNIDLLKLNTLNLANDYMDVNLSNGFLQLITRATRIQGRHFSLIDHILSNNVRNGYSAGTILHDLSDHFINYMQLPVSNHKPKPKPLFKRNFSATNILNFKASLSGSNWNPVLVDNDVNSSFDTFWNIFIELYELHFPLVKFKFNKNIHKINNYLTAGLLISRKTKLELCKKAALAKLCGICPIPASSGKTTRMRLNRGGNRQANAAIYRVAVVRMRDDDRTKAYAARRTAEGKTRREIVRCIKRYIVREVYTALCATKSTQFPT